MTVLRRVLPLALLTLGLNAATAQTAKFVGSWEFAPDANNPIEMAQLNPVFTFDADGAIQIRYDASEVTEAQNLSGTYTVDGDTMIARLNGEQETARYWFDKGDLYIDDGTDVIHFRRKSGC